jgi:hypothetical protein
VSLFYATVVILVDFLCVCGVEGELKLPRYWNDVLGDEEVIPENEKISTNPIHSHHEPPAATTGSNYRK